MPNIDPEREYSIQEVAEAGFIPGLDTHTKVYNLITMKTPGEDGKPKRVPATETTKTSIKASGQRPWGKISGKLKIKGEEIIRFLSLHNLS